MSAQTPASKSRRRAAARQAHTAYVQSTMAMQRRKDRYEHVFGTPSSYEYPDDEAADFATRGWTRIVFARVVAEEEGSDA